MFLTAVLLSVSTPAFADDYNLDTDLNRIKIVEDDGTKWNLARESASTIVDATPEEVWAELADFGAVNHVFESITESYWVEGSTEMTEDCARFCHIEFAGRSIDIKERVEVLEEGRFYTYDVYEWENFPLKKMMVTFWVDTDNAGNTVLTNIIDFRINPGLMTGMARGQMESSAQSSVFAYKHYLETGRADLDGTELIDLYASR